ncbi:MAG: SMP-30/gluconolactonase/LRE family protein [Pseudomonadota bacterium]
MRDLTLEPWVSGFCFGEGPRWHNGNLWFSDTIGQAVYRLSGNGELELVTKIPDMPSGLGFLEDGRLVVVGMTTRTLYAWDDHALTTYADLSEFTPFPINDMVVDTSGNAFVGGWGYDMLGGAEPAPAELIHIGSDGSKHLCSDGLSFPNGCVVTPDQTTLIVAESQGQRLTRYSIQEAKLSARAVWAALPNRVPDGICQDEAGGIWAASPETKEVIRVLEGGEVTHLIKTERKPYACALGGAEGKTLFVMVADTIEPAVCLERRDAAVECVLVPYKGLEHSGAELT